MQTPLRVFVVEDLTPIRQALVLLLDGTPGFACAGEASTVAAAIAAPEKPAPDVVLLDVSLPDGTGIDTLPEIKRKWPSADVLMFTVHADEERVFDALRNGANGYLLKGTPPAELLEAIQEVRAGGAPMDTAVARKVVRAFHQPASAASLTERERQVLDGLAAGQTYREVGDALFVSTNTVKYHVKEIYAKLQVGSRAEAVARYKRRWL